VGPRLLIVAGEAARRRLLTGFLERFELPMTVFRLQQG
jgi:hypothetical protein